MRYITQNGLDLIKQPMVLFLGLLSDRLFLPGWLSHYRLWPCYKGW